MTPAQRVALDLERLLGPSRVLTDPELCAGYARDESEAAWVVPPCVVLAETAADVVAALRACERYGVPVVPRGAGTGRTGGATVTAPGVVLDTSRLGDLKDIDRANGVAVVGAGMRTGALHAAVEREGLFYPPDPQSAEWCCLGGNVAENAGGPRAVKYGVTRDWVLGLECAHMDGALVQHGRRTAKGVTGYDTVGLLVGSEGTLGVFTEVTLRLTALPTAVRGVLAVFADAVAAGRAVAALLASGARPRCIELLDAICCDVMRADDPAVLPAGAGAALVIEVDGFDDAAVAREAQRAGEACAAAGAVSVHEAVDAAERAALWAVRRVMSRALRGRAAHKLSEDVVVPRAQVAELIARVQVIAAEERVVMPTYGHAGDGNLHVNLLWDHDDERPRVQRAIERLFRATLDLRGTLSGEHGIGVLKAPYLAWEQGPALIELQQRVKTAFDPRGLLNPGKIFGASATHRGC
ncbi:MAG: FAD-linked oxidase C-terminal domain-containing protein [Myxococcales bacterium]|nr:FAD-linked oxidase C-terminal domain-containing protein [Myxococcales bacterium]